MDEGMFEELGAFLAEAHAEAGREAGALVAERPLSGLRAVPTALVMAGGMNAADHARTFPDCAQYLEGMVRAWGCW